MANPKLVAKTDIYVAMRFVMNMLLDITVQFPKAYKYTFGSKMHELSISCLQCISKAYITRDIDERIHWLVQMQCDFEVLKTLVSTAGERGWIKGKGKHGQLVEAMVSTGKQCTAWKNSLIKVRGRKPEPQGYDQAGEQSSE